MANIIYIAYAYSKDDPLNQVPAELQEVIAVFKKTSCSVELEERVTQEALEQRFASLKKEILIFHFSGHATGTGLELNMDQLDTMNLIDMDAFARIIGQDGQGLKLVFLNGCSTHDQVVHLRAQGVPAVIATVWPLDDAYAYRFAKSFYANFINTAYSYTLQQAFERTMNSFDANQSERFFDASGKPRNRSLLHASVRGNLDFDDHGRPAKIYELVGDAVVLQQRFADWLQPEAEKMLRLGENDQQAGDLEKALYHYQVALDIYKSANDRGGVERTADALKDLREKLPPKLVILADSADEVQSAMLNKYLTVLKRNKKVRVYATYEAKGGEIPVEQARKELVDADYVLALITINLFSSEEWFELVLESLRANRIVIPILIGKVGIRGTELEGRKSLPSMGRAVPDFSSSDEAYADIVAEINKLIRQ